MQLLRFKAIKLFKLNFYFIFIYTIKALNKRFELIQGHFQAVEVISKKFIIYFLIKKLYQSKEFNKNRLIIQEEE